MKIIWSPIALERIEEIVEYISLDSESIARKVAISLFKAVDRLKKFPKSGRMVPEAKRSDVREVVKTGFRIIYRTEKNRLFILTVRHSRRKISIGEIARAKDIIESEDPMRGLTMQ